MSAQRAFQVPRSAEGITEILNHVQMAVPDRAGYMAISQSEGGRFAEAVAKVGNGVGDSDAVLEYVRNVVAGAHPDARTAAALAGFGSVEPVRLIDIAKKEGRSFRNAVRLVLADGQRAEQATALAYLQNLLEEYGVVSGGEPGLSEVPYPSERPSRPAPAAPAPAAQNIRDFPSNRSAVAETPIRAPSPDPVQDEKPKWGDSFHVYAGKAALCFCEVVTRQSDKATVMIEAARSKGDSYDWNDKVLLMLTIAELPLVLGFYFGYLDTLELKGHGKQKEKAVTFANQGNQFFITVLMRGQPPRAVPMPPKDSYPVISMLLKQMLKNDPFLTADLILQITKRICDMHAAERKRTESV